MTDKILQGSEAWLQAKQSKISASEIFSLVLHYCKPELEKMGFDLKEERSFRTVQELFMKVKFDAKLSEIDPVHSEFGCGLEPYVAYRLKQELPQLVVERSKDFIVNEILNPLAACSPDGYIELPFAEIDNEEPFLVDFDKTCRITAHWGNGVLELKTANYFANFGADKGSRLNYIFQNQFQMMVLGLKWGCLAVLTPKEKEYDEPFFKGKILNKVQLWEEDNSVWSTTGEPLGDEINQYYNLNYYIYPQLPAFQQTIMKSLIAFQSDLDKYDEDSNVFPRKSEDLAGLQREKALWGQLWPQNFGEKQLEDGDELDILLNERYQAQCEKLFAEQNLEKINNEIFQKVKATGLDKFCKINGTENRITWTKNGQVRFYKNR